MADVVVDVFAFSLFGSRHFADVRRAPEVPVRALNRRNPEFSTACGKLRLALCGTCCAPQPGSSLCSLCGICPHAATADLGAR